MVLSRSNEKHPQSNTYTYTVNWNIPGTQDKRSFIALEHPEKAVELGGMGGQRAERKQMTQTKASVQLHHRSVDREAPAHVSRLPPVLSLSAVADITSLFPLWLSY